MLWRSSHISHELVRPPVTLLMEIGECFGVAGMAPLFCSLHAKMFENIGIDAIPTDACKLPWNLWSSRDAILHFYCYIFDFM